MDRININPKVVFPNKVYTYRHSDGDTYNSGYEVAVGSRLLKDFNRGPDEVIPFESYVIELKEGIHAIPMADDVANICRVRVNSTTKEIIDNLLTRIPEEMFKPESIGVTEKGNLTFQFSLVMDNDLAVNSTQIPVIVESVASSLIASGYQIDKIHTGSQNKVLFVAMRVPE